MRSRFMSPIFTVIAVLAFSPAIFAQAPKGAADLSGVWAGPTRDEASKLPRVPNEPIAPTKWNEEQYIYNHDFDPTNGGGRVRAEVDPSHRCFPGGVTVGGAPEEIVVTPKKVVIFYENNHEVRQIYTDGREHPKGEDLQLQWQGDSIGKWDGDTLVVDTVGIRDENLLGGGGYAHSTQLHIVERYKRIDKDTLQIDATYDDPVALAKPWVRHMFLKLKTDWDILPNVLCDEKYRKGLYHGESASGL